MERKSAKELIKRVLNSIAETPKSIHEIAQDCESNWESVKIYLESLKEAGVVQETEVGNKRVFSIPQRNVVKKTGNYFDLPITLEDEKTIDSVFCKIKEEWIKKAGNVPGRIQVQKSLAKINKYCKLQLPIGWYLFGAVCVKPYDPLMQYPYSGLDNQVLMCVNEVVEGFSAEPSASSLKLRCYNEEDNELYKTKEILLALLSSQKFSRKYVQEINSQLYSLLKCTPPIFDELAKDSVNEFVGVVLQLVNNLPDDELQLVKNDVCAAFNEIWRLIALYNYFSDLEPYYVKNFSREVELKHFLTEIALQKTEVVEYLKHLNDLVPALPEPDDENYRKIKELLGSVKLLTPEEQKEREAELERIRKEKGEKGVQDRALKEFGLE